MMRCWEGKPSKLVAIVLPRKRVFVVNLTHDRGRVQFSSVHSEDFCSWSEQSSSRGLN